MAATFANAVTNGVVNISTLTEASGVAASRNNPGVLWAQNDAGNAAEVHAINSQGRFLGTYALPANTDSEDIGVGPGPVTNVSYLYIGDIGDNNSKRTNIQIYQVPEPAVYAWQTNSPYAARALRGMRIIHLTYPDGAHDAEAEFVDPLSGDWFVLTKETGTSRVYTAPKSLLNSSTNIALSLVRSLPFNEANGADISPLGNEILIRQENFAGLWTRTNGQTVSAALAGSSNNIPVTGVAGGEPNGEAIGFDSYGGGYFTLSDSIASGVQPLRYFARTSFDGPTPPRVLVPMASSWKYLDNGANPGATWKTSDFTDGSWSNGLAQLGYGDGDEQTVVGYGGDANNKFITTYFRKTVVVTNVNRIANTMLKLVVGDGVIVFLNGSPVVNLNLATNAAHNALASAMPAALRDTWQSFAVDPKLLVEGTNLLAAEVHLASATSSSLSFDLQLLATEAPSITAISRLTNSAKLFITGSSNSLTTVQAANLIPAWTNIGTVLLTNGNGIFTDTSATNFAARFYRAYRTLP